jgi:hypothetical protein
LNKKLAKYAGNRGNTPMLGLALYFQYTGNQYVGPILAALDSLKALDRALGIAKYLGAATIDRLHQSLMSPFSPEDSATVLTLPIEQPLSMVLWVAGKTDGPRVILIVNMAVLGDAHPFASHPVITWLREWATPTPGTILVPPRAKA